MYNIEKKNNETKIRTHNVQICNLGKLPLSYWGFTGTAANNIYWR